MTILNTEDSVIFIIDIQEKLLNAVFNKEIIAKKSTTLAQASNILQVPVILTEQYPKGLGNTVNTIKEHLSEHYLFEKTDFNALNDENVLNLLNKLGRKNIIVCGIETHICVHQTVEALIKNGFKVTVVKDSCSSRFEEEYLQALRVMETSGANIKTTEMILFELLKGAKHPNFKEIQALIK